MKKLLLSMLITASLYGCSPVYYSPPSQNVPMLSREKEFTLAAGLVEAESANGMELKGAYAVSPHVGLIAGINGYFPDNKSDSTSYGSGGLIEGGAGYFTPVSDKFVFETYGLLGYGWMKNYFPESINRNPGTDGKINANIFSIGVQPSFGYKSKYFEAAFSTKGALLNYTNIRGNLMESSEGQSSDVSQQQYLKDNKGNFMLEPALTLRGGLEFLKLQLQLGKSFNLSHPNFPQDEGWVSIGLFYRVQ